MLCKKTEKNPPLHIFSIRSNGIGFAVFLRGVKRIELRI
jgi:hypothetical protein